jgi:hypothetical protein
MTATFAIGDEFRDRRSTEEDPATHSNRRDHSPANQAPDSGFGKAGVVSEPCNVAKALAER